MSDKELELTKGIVTLSNNVIADKEKEREINAKKSFYQMLVTLAIIICFGSLWFYEIHEAYKNVSVSASASACAETIEKRGEK